MDATPEGSKVLCLVQKPYIYKSGMRKLIALSISGVIFMLTLFSCSNNRRVEAAKSSVKERDYVKYVEMTGMARSAAGEENHELALNHYLEAFTHWSPEGYDLLNAAICASKRGKRDLAEKLLERSVAEAGLEKDQIESFHDWIQSNPQW